MIEPISHARDAYSLQPGYADATWELPPGNKPQPSITWALAIRAVRRWWKTALPAGLFLAAGAVAAVYFTFKPVYEASAWLQIEDRALHLAFTSEPESTKFVQTQVEILRSPLIVGPVVSRPEIAQLAEFQQEPAASAPIEYVRKKLKIKAEGTSELYTISWEGTDPNGAAAIVNAVVDTYLQLRKNQDAERTQRVIELVQQERDRGGKEVELLQQQIRELTKQVTGKDPFLMRRDNKTNDVIHQVTDLQSRLTESEVRRVFLEAEMAAFQESPRTIEVTKEETDKAVENSAEVRTFAAKIAQEQSVLKEMQARMGPASAAHYEVRAAALKEEEAQLARLSDNVRKQAKAEIERSRQAQSQKKLSEMKSERKSMVCLEELLKKRIEETRKNMSESSTGSLELVFLQADLRRQEDVYDEISSRLVALRTEQRAPGRVNLFQKAEIPQMPQVATPYMKMIPFGGLAFMLPLGLALLLEKLMQRISSAQQIKEQFHLPMVNEVARLPALSTDERSLASSHLRQDLQLFRESIDSLRVSLFTSEALKGMQVLAVTSAATNEGKTSVAVQLAVSIARASGESVLIVDGDMRSPDVHRVLGVGAAPGLAELLAHEVSLDDGPILTWASRVDVLPAGYLRGNPHGLLGDGRFNSLLDELRRRYRYIIIDTPPVLAASEAVLLNVAADASLLCTMRDVSRLDQAIATHTRLVAAGSPPVCVVLNGVPTRQYGYRYGEYYARHEA